MFKLPMSQMSFFDFEYAGKRKQTRRERFLAEMDETARLRTQDFQVYENKQNEFRTR